MAGPVFVGLPKLLKKLDATIDAAEGREIIADVGNQARGVLLKPMPARWDRPRQVNLQTTPKSARITMPSFPYIFFERGSQGGGRTGGASTGERSRRRKTARQFREGGAYSIKPRRFLARTRVFIRKELIAQIQQLKARIERGWSA